MAAGGNERHAVPGRPGRTGDADSIANEFQCQPWQDKGCEKDRQEPLSGASEGDDLFLGGVEGLSAARVSSIANLQGVTPRLDWYLDRVVHFDRPGPLTVDHDIVRATTDLRLPYASPSASPAFADLLWCLNGNSLAASAATATCRRPGAAGPRGAGRRNRWRHTVGSGTPVLRRPREGIRGSVAPGHRMAVAANTDSTPGAVGVPL